MCRISYEIKNFEMHKLSFRLFRNSTYNCLLLQLYTWFSFCLILTSKQQQEKQQPSTVKKEESTRFYVCGQRQSIHIYTSLKCRTKHALVLVCTKTRVVLANVFGSSSLDITCELISFFLLLLVGDTSVHGKVAATFTHV